MPASWKTIRVFISSTFKDMQAERDHLVRFVFPKIREELIKHSIHLVDVDLRWGVTSDQDALGVCREVIDECHPRFMCILGGRYGWVPVRKDKSITADEVHYGVLDREAAKRGRAFFYFRDDQATAEMLEETPGEYREPEGSGNAGKLAALKKSIKDAGLPVVEYRARWSKDQKRLIDLENFGERVHDDLLQSLKGDPDLANHFTKDGSTAPDEFAEEAAQIEAFIEERTERYVVGSRDGVLKEMQNFAADSGTPNIFVLTGAPGSGKSALLAQFCRSLPDSASLSLLISHFIGASTGSTDLRRTLRRLCNELAKAAENTEPLPLDIKELITHFQKLLIDAAAKHRVILVFDALNQFDETDGAHWMNWLPRELPPGVRIIASVIAPAEGEKEHQALAILRNRKDARVEALKPLNESDTQAIIEGYLKRYSKRLSREQIAALNAKPASNLPLYILTALEELRTLGTYEEITDRIRTLPGDARALFGWILTERLARDPGFRDREGRPCGAALVTQFASCLGVSRHGLSPAELTALLDPGDPLGNVAALLRLLRPYLMRRGELLDFYHGQFRDAVETAYLDTATKQRHARQLVAEHFSKEVHPTNRKLDELPRLLLKLEEWNQLKVLLTDIPTLIRFGQRSSMEWQWELLGYWAETHERFDVGSEYLRALATWRATTRRTDDEILFVTRALAKFLLLLADYRAAEPLLRQVLDLETALRGPNSVEVALRLDELGQLLHNTRRLKDSEQVYRRALNILKNHAPQERKHVSRVAGNLAIVLAQDDRIGEAVPFARESLVITEELFGPRHPLVARALINMVACHIPGLMEAESLVRRAISIDEEFYGLNHPEVATDLVALVPILHAQSRVDDEVECLRRAIQIVEISCGDDHERTIAFRTRLAGLLQSVGELSEAAAEYRRALLSGGRTADRLGSKARGGIFYLQCALANVLYRLWVRAHENQSPDAARLWRESLELRRSALSSFWTLTPKTEFVATYLLTAAAHAVACLKYFWTSRR